MIAAYEQAFGSRSTWRERASSIDHLCDLRDLLDEDDDRCASITEAIAALERWERDNWTGGTMSLRRPGAHDAPRLPPGRRSSPGT